MPRMKVKIEPIEKKQAQQVTLSKRRRGLFKKAKELAIMCNAQVGVIVFSAANNFTKYAHPSLDEIIRRRYQDLQPEKPPVDLELKQEYERVKTKYVDEELIVSQMEGSKLENLPMERLNQLVERMENTLRLLREKKENIVVKQRDLPGPSNNIIVEQRDQPGPSNVAQEQVVVPEERSQPKLIQFL